jgi:hypothetical protein
MYASMLFALELYKVRRDDLLRQAAEYRLGRCSRRESSGHTRVLETLNRGGYLEEGMLKRGSRVRRK